MGEAKPSPSFDSAALTPNQTPLTFVVPVRSPEAASALLRLMPALEAETRKSMTRLPEVHFFRCVLINGGTELAIIATVDGELDPFLDKLIAEAGTLLDCMLEFTTPPVPLPVSLRRTEFKRYVRAHNAPAPFWYGEAAKITATELRIRAETAAIPPGDPTSKPLQNTLCAILDVRSIKDAVQLRQLILSTSPRVLAAFDSVGTVHFARFLFLNNETKFAIITAFDGTFEAYSRDFVDRLGPVFDALLPHVEGGDSNLIPVKEHFDAFHRIIVDSNFSPPSIWYSAYPSLSVQNVRKLKG